MGGGYGQDDYEEAARYGGRQTSALQIFSVRSGFFAVFHLLMVEPCVQPSKFPTIQV
jgi:hypothetical protein